MIDATAPPWLRRLVPLCRRLARREAKSSVDRVHLRVQILEDRRLLTCISPDPFICTPLPTEGRTVNLQLHMTIEINGQQQVIPANIGITLATNGQPSSFLPIHTHNATGTIDVESPINRSFHLRDFFDTWGRAFDQFHILGFHTDAASPVVMTVNGQSSSQYGDLLLRDRDEIKITATSALPPGPYFAVGGNGHVQIRLDADGVIVGDFMPFGASYTGGVSVAVGGLNRNGFKDLVVSTTANSPQVKVYSGAVIRSGTFNPDNPDAALMVGFLAFDPQFNVGCNVAVGDVLGDGYGEIVTGASAGNPDIRVFRGQDIGTGTFNANGSSLLTQFFAYGLQYNVGANVAVGDLNGDGFADVVTGASVGNPHVKVYSGRAIATHTLDPANPDNSLLASFFAYGLNFNVGAFVAVGDTNGDGFPDLVTGASVGNPEVKVYDGAAIAHGTFDNNHPDASLLGDFFAYDLGMNIGAAVAAADFESNGRLDILTGATVAPHYRVVNGNATGIIPPLVNGIEGVPPDIHGGIQVGA